jgi:N-hydroxyarylamine O-acetyltransferase
MKISSYLERIGYKEPVELSAEVLSELHYVHLLNVPFENLDIHLGRPILLNEDHLFEKIVTYRRGGFCYELNGLFAALLRELGFKVDLLSARVYENGEFGPELDHLTLRVRLEDDWLVDVGFGDNFLRPLRLFETGAQVQSGVAYHVHRRSSDWELLEMDEQGEWQRSYSFDLQPRQLSDYTERCTYHQTSPKSHFTQKRLCTRATPEGRISLSGRRLLTSKRGQRREKVLADEKTYLSALDRYFGIRLPSL